MEKIKFSLKDAFLYLEEEEKKRFKEIKEKGEFIEPETKVNEREVVIGRLTKNEKSLYTLYREIKEKKERSEVQKVYEILGLLVRSRLSPSNYFILYRKNFDVVIYESLNNATHIIL